MKNNRPNLFDFATSELSQDAFFCWLLSWLKKDYEGGYELKKIAFELLQAITGDQLNLKYHLVNGQVNVHRQVNNIDIMVELLSYDRVIIIEDKIHGHDSKSKQKKYIEAVTQKENGFLEKRYSKEQIMSSYIKIGIIDSKDKALQNEPLNAQLVSIEELNNLLGPYEIDNAIYTDYKNHIRSKVEKRKQAKSKLFEKNDFDPLKSHIGQSLFFNELVEAGLKPIDEEKECYLKTGTSTGGQKWTELWITSHGKNNWEYDDAIFYRIEFVTRNHKKVPSLTLRQYNNRFNQC